MDKKSRFPLFVALVYAMVGTGWILGGHALSGALYSGEAAPEFELLKGLTFVAVTATVLFVMLRRLDAGSDAKFTLDEIPGRFSASIRDGERSLRRLPVQLAMLVTVALCLLLLGLSWMRENALRTGETTAQAVQFTIAAQISSSLRLVDITLTDITQDVAAVKTTDADVRRSTIASHTLPPVARTLSMVDENGRMNYNSDGRISTEDFSGREYFLYHRDNPQSGFHVSNPFRSVFTNAWVIAASRAVRGPAGEFRGVVVAVLDLERFGRYWQVPGFDQHGNITLFRDDGTVLLRSPHSENAPLRLDKRALKWLALLPTQPVGVYHARSAIDGFDKIFAYGRVQQYPEFVLVFGVPEHQLLQQWRHFAALSLGAFMIFASVVAVFVFVMQRHQRASLASERSAAALARYPLQNRNPVMTVARDGKRLFMNEAARILVKSDRDAGTGAMLDAALASMAAEKEAGTREIHVGARVIAASYVPHPAGYCDFYLTDITAMRRGEELQRLFFELPFIGMAITSPETKRWLKFNDRLCEILGYSREALQQKTWAELTHPDDLNADVAEFERVLRGETDRYSKDKRYLRLDGTTVYAQVNVQAIRRPDGSVDLILATVQDISDRKQREHSLGQQRDLYAALSATNEAVVRLRDRDALFRRICEAAVEKAGFAFAWIGLLNRADHTVRPVARYGDDQGYIDNTHFSVDPARHDGRGTTALAINQDRHQIVNNIAGTWYEPAAQAGVQSLATFPIRQGGTAIGALKLYARERDYFDADIVKLLDEMVADVSYALDNLEGEQRLRESETKFKGLVEQSIVGIFIADDINVYYVNPRTAEIFGYFPDEILGPKLGKLICAEDLPTIRDQIRKLLSGEIREIRSDFCALHHDGSTVHIGAHGSRGEYGGKPVVIGVLQDVTQRLQNEAKLAEYVARLEQSIKATTNAISEMVELRDPYTAGHERRVAGLAMAIGTELGLPAHDTAGLSIMGHVHDVGKINAPAEILSKPGRLSPLEYEIIKTHTEKGYEILKKIDFPWPVADVVRQHHERMDGSGYPGGLKGKDILLAARIIAVADVVESMSSHRPYRPALGIKAALEEIEKNAGRLYDHEVVAACLRLFREKNYQFPD